MDSVCMQELSFTPVTVAAFSEILPYFEGKSFIASEYSALYIFMWGGYLGIEYAVCDGVLFLRRNNRHGISYYPPLLLGRPLADGLSYLSRIGGEGLTLCSIPEQEMEAVEGAVTVLDKDTSRRWADYVYAAEDLATLRGHRYNKKRNLVHQFEKLYPEHRTARITAGDIPRLVAFMEHFMADPAMTDDERRENELVLRVLRAFEQLPVVGMMLLVGEEIAAFTLGEEVDGTLLVHVEKADRRFKGAYQTINQRFAAERVAESGIRYINREDDTGDEGLRRAKLSYCPVMVLHKYRATVRVSD